MKYDSLKKVQSRISYNRYLYYEPKSANKPEEEKEQNSLLFGLGIRLLMCSLIFGVLLIFGQMPVLSNITVYVKNAVKQNYGVFEIEQPGSIPIRVKIMAVLYPDKTPLEYDKPLITQNIQYRSTYALLISEQNPLIYSSEAGTISKVVRKNGVITVEIKHRNNTITRYEGLEFAGVSLGQNVDKNFPIGIIGQSGQLKFGIVIDGNTVNDISTEVQWD